MLEELEASIAADPDGSDAWTVYTDALHVANDPRGELAAIQRERAVRDRPELAGAERALLERHGRALLGQLGDPAPRVQLHIASDRRVPIADGYTLSWAHGHLRSIEIHEPYAVEPTAGQVLQDVLARPVARFASRIALLPPGGWGVKEVTARALDLAAKRGRAVVRAIADAPRPALRSLAFGCPVIPFDLDGEDEARGAVTHAGEDLGDLAPLWRSAPNLRDILISGGGADLGDLALPELRMFELRQSHIPPANLDSLVRAHLPKLESLVLWLGAADYGEVNYTAAALAPLCDPERVPSLRHLGFVCSAGTEAIAQMVLDSAILPQLESLDLSGGTLANARVFVDAAPRCAHLQSLDLRWNPLSGDDALTDVLPSARVLPARLTASELPRFNACQE